MSEIKTKPSNDKYREGWERAFGEKPTGKTFRIGDHFELGKDKVTHVLSQCSSESYVFIDPRWGSRFSEHVKANCPCSQIPESVVDELARGHPWKFLGLETENTVK